MALRLVCLTNLTQQLLNLFLRTGLADRLGKGLLSGLLEDSVDTIWQCTVPNNSMRHNGPTTSLAQAAGTSKYNTAPATAMNTNPSAQNPSHTETFHSFSNEVEGIITKPYLSAKSEIFKE